MSLHAIDIAELEADRRDSAWRAFCEQSRVYVEALQEAVMPSEKEERRDS